MFVHLAAFFVTAMVCHGELVRARPQARYLTEFYIWMSVGGVLGGLFNALVAPLAFTSVVEYPLVVALACCLRPSAGTLADGQTVALASRPARPAAAAGRAEGLAWTRPWQYIPAWTDQASRLPRESSCWAWRDWWCSAPASTRAVRPLLGQRAARQPPVVQLHASARFLLAGASSASSGCEEAIEHARTADNLRQAYAGARLHHPRRSNGSCGTRRVPSRRRHTNGRAR